MSDTFFYVRVVFLFILLFFLYCWLLFLIRLFLLVLILVFLSIFIVNFNSVFQKLQLFFNKLFGDLVHTILVRQTLNLRTKSLLLPRKMPTCPRIIHLFNFCALILFVENLRLLLRLAKNNKPRRQPIQPMKHKQILIPFLNVQNRQQRIIMKPTTSVNSEAWWFVYNEVILIIFNYVYLEV